MKIYQKTPHLPVFLVRHSFLVVRPHLVLVHLAHLVVPVVLELRVILVDPKVLWLLVDQLIPEKKEGDIIYSVRVAPELQIKSSKQNKQSKHIMLHMNNNIRDIKLVCT